MGVGAGESGVQRGERLTPGLGGDEFNRSEVLTSTMIKQNEIKTHVLDDDKRFSH